MKILLLMTRTLLLNIFLFVLGTFMFVITFMCLYSLFADGASIITALVCWFSVTSGIAAWMIIPFRDFFTLDIPY
jgi:uncharacterized membrane protein